MNNEDKLKAALKNDAALRDAIRQDEMEAPKMPSDLNARLMKRMAAEAPTASRTRKLWPWIAAACAVAFIAVFITPPKYVTEGAEMVAKVEKAEAPAQTAPAPALEAVEAKAELIAPIAPAAPKAAPVAPAAPKAAPTPVAPKATKAAAKPANAAPAMPEAIEPAAEHVLAAATTAPKAVAEEKMVTMSERDIPITRPENYKYTPEELALLKKQAAEAYLKWVELEMEISRNNMQTAEAK